MEKILKHALVEAEAFEMMKAYGVEVSVAFGFVSRQDDFYITLISRMMGLLDELENVKDSDSEMSLKQGLAEIAKGLLVYSETYTAKGFYGVNQINNHLFVASIYYICDYEAIASLLLKEYRIGDYETNAAQLMFYIISGCRATQAEVAERYGVVREFDQYLETGDAVIFDDIVKVYETKRKAYDFSTLRDFIDSSILLHVLRKFRLSNIWTDLKQYAPDIDWTEYVNYSKGERILSFLPSQREALKNGLLTFEQSFSLGLATSGGKSYITELLVFQEIKRNPLAKILYLAPLRSLSRELKERFRKVGKKLNIKCACKYGGNVIDEGDASLEEAQLLISTPETFITLEGVLNEELREFSLIICDEGQLLDDWSRGINYELLLTRLKKQEHKRFLFLSAIIPNIEDINTWLGGQETQVSKCPYRPCELRYGIIKKGNGVVDVEIWDRELQGVSYLMPAFVRRELCRRQLGSKTDVVCLTALKALLAGPVMIYTSTKNGTMGCVKVCEKLEKSIKLVPELDPRQSAGKEEMLDDGANYVAFQLGNDFPLVGYMRHGYAYHHGDLPQDIREVIESLYSRSLLPLIVSTSTLAEGVNMPVKTLILHNLLSPMSFNPPRFMPVSSVKNIVGRVGRAGRQKYGLVLVPESDKGSAEKLVRKALQVGTLQPIKGMLYDLVMAMSDHNWQEATEEQINNLLEEEGLADGIDLMISRNAEDLNVEDVSPVEVCHNSLAYKLGSENERSMLNKVFTARYSRIRDLAESNDYTVFIDTGLSLGAFFSVKQAINEDDLDKYRGLNESSQTDFLRYIATLVVNAKLLDEIQNKDRFAEVTLMFMAGSTYTEIAQRLGVSIEEVLRLTNCSQNRFAEMVRSIFLYVKGKYDINTPFLEEWPDYLKYGVSTSFEYELVTNRLADRTVVHGVSDYVREVLNARSADIMLLKVYPEKVLSFLRAKGYPRLSIEKAQRWLMT